MRKTGMISETTARQRAFWAAFAERLPDLSARMVRGNESTRWLVVGRRPLVAGHYYSNKAAGIFVRGSRGERTALVREWLFPCRDILAAALGQPDIRLGTNFLLVSRFRADMTDRENWPASFDWFEEMSPVYERALVAVQRRR